MPELLFLSMPAAAFMQNRDPLTRRACDDAYRPLFKPILMTLTAPLGLGPAMEAMRVSYPSDRYLHDVFARWTTLAAMQTQRRATDGHARCRVRQMSRENCSCARSARR